MEFEPIRINPVLSLSIKSVDGTNVLVDFTNNNEETITAQVNYKENTILNCQSKLSLENLIGMLCLIKRNDREIFELLSDHEGKLFEFEKVERLQSLHS